MANELATIAAAKALAPKLRPRQVILLDGPLGAGKSTFARALIQALPGPKGESCAQEPVPSPTYTLVQTYVRALGMVGHFDLYRLTNPEEIWDLGLEPILENGLALIEWGDRLGSLRPANALGLRFEDQGQGRHLYVEGGTLPEIPEPEPFVGRSYTNGHKK